MYVEGSVVKLAQFFRQDAYFQQMMTGMICYNAAIYCLRVASAGRQFAQDAASPDDALRQLFVGAPNPVQAHLIRADCVVGILRKSSQAGAFALSHVMISVDGVGGCIGSNNGAIGGPPNWNYVNLAQALVWRPQRNPVYRDPMQPAAPDWATERAILVKPVRELLAVA